MGLKWAAEDGVVPLTGQIAPTGADKTIGIAPRERDQRSGGTPVRRVGGGLPDQLMFGDHGILTQPMKYKERQLARARTRQPARGQAADQPVCPRRQQHITQIDDDGGDGDAMPGFMRDEAKANEAKDKEEKERIDKINAADSNIFATEKQLKEYGDKLPADKKSAIEGALAKLKEAHKNADVAAIDTAIAELNAAWQAASQDIYAQQQAQGAQPGADAGQFDNSQTLQWSRHGYRPSPLSTE